MKTTRTLADWNVGHNCNAGFPTRESYRQEEPTGMSALPEVRPSTRVRRLLVLALSLSFSAFSRAEEPYVLWASTAGGLSFSGGAGIAVAPSGELVVASSVFFASYLGSIMRFDPRGSMVSSNTARGASLGGVTVDSSGALYLTGKIGTNGFFDFPTVQGFFTAKFSTNYTLLWVKSREYQGQDEDYTSRGYDTRGTAIALDPQGNVIVGGSATGRITMGAPQFGQGPGPVLCKYDQDGNLLWARVIDHSPSSSFGATINSLAVDLSGNIVICGYLSEGTTDFGGTTVFPGSTGHSQSAGDFYIARYKPNGDLDWVQLGYAMTIALDSHGDIYFSFSWATEGLTGIGKLSSEGALLWSKTFSNAQSFGYSQGIAVDAQDQPVFTGEFQDTATFDTVTLRARSATWSDFFVAKTDPQGNVQWAISGGGTEFDRGERVVCDSLGNVFVTASIRKDIGGFDGLTLVPQSVSETTMVVAKLSQKPILSIGRSAQNISLSWPAKATNYILEAATSLPEVSWDPVTNNPTVGPTERSLQLPAMGNARFFRLRQP